MAADWAAVLSAATPGEPQIFAGDGETFLVAWVEARLILQKGPSLMERFTPADDALMHLGGDKWIVGTACHGKICVAAGFKDIQRSYAVRALVALIFLPLLMIFGISMIAMGAAVRSGLAPLTSLAASVRARSPEDLSPVNGTAPLREVNPLVKAINGLMADMREQLRKERDFLNTCAHELRTPVAGLIAQIQSLEKVDCGTDAKLKNVQESARRVSRTADQILTLARTSNADRLGEETERFDLCELVRQVTLDVVSPWPGIECTMTGVESLPVTCSPLAVEILCRNLIENAVRHGIGSCRKGSITVRCDLEGDRIVLLFENSGAAIAPAEVHRVFERFYRSPDTASGGAGLGLAIARDIARHYGGDVSINSAFSMGTQVRVELARKTCRLN